MRVGGFVIHGNAASTLAGCLQDLKEACDEVVAVDSGSTDGSAELAASAGVRRVEFPWQGFGAARAAAVRALPDCEWIFFLDADERLEPGSVSRVREATRATRSSAFRCTVRDWAGSGAQRYLYRAHHRVRLLRRSSCGWTPDMIVHESSGSRANAYPGIVIDHAFAPDQRLRSQKQQLYAWLWAARASNEGKRAKHPGLQRCFHFFKDAVLKGAALRGGVRGARLAWSVSEYHALKYEYLAQLRAGRASVLSELHRRCEFAALFREARRLIAD